VPEREAYASQVHLQLQVSFWVSYPQFVIYYHIFL
jgi:hypothetical protein